MGKALNEEEELMILKKVFYEFALREVKTLIGENDYNIGNFLFIDKQKPDKAPSTIIGSLIKANIDLFDEKKREERVLTHIKISIERIEKKRENSENIVYLQDITDLNFLEAKAYYELLDNIMSTRNPDGHLINPKQSGTVRLYYEYKHIPPFSME